MPGDRLDRRQPGDRLDRRPAFYRMLARLLPREFRAGAGPDLERAAMACLARERARFGPIGTLFAWVRLTADTVGTSAALHFSAPPPTTPRRGFIEAFMDNLKKDLLYALRGLRRQPGFAALTVLTLALGIGANTAIFSVVNGVLLRPLPYPNAEQLEYVTTTFPALGFDQFWMSIPEVLELEKHNQSFSSLGAYRAAEFNVDTTPPIRPTVGVLTPGFLPTLGVRPLMGRWFTEADSVPGAPRVTILSWEMWQQTFAGDPNILGQTFRADTITRTIVGVMPPGFDVHDARIEVWVPAIIDPKTLPNNRGSHSWYVVARRKDGVSAAQARADLQQMQTHWQDFVPAGSGHVFLINNPNPATRHELRIDPLKADVIGDIRTALLILQGAVAFVLLIACANLANLLLARAESRQREFAVRTALGAGRRRLFSQFVTEGLVLSVLAAAAGVGLAWFGLRTLLRISPDAIPRSAEIGLDGRVLLFTLGLTIITGFIFGLAPLANLGKRVMVSLRDGTRTSGTRAQKTVRGALVVAEVTLAVVLVAGAGLLIRSLGNLMTVDAGFKREQLVTFRLVLPGVTYNAPQRVEFFGRLEDALRRLPGVSSVASMNGLPPSRSVDANDTDFEHIPNNAPAGSGAPDRERGLLADREPEVHRDHGDSHGARPIIRSRRRHRSARRARQRSPREAFLQGSRSDRRARSSAVSGEPALDDDRRHRQGREATRRQRAGRHRDLLPFRAGATRHDVRAERLEHRASDEPADRRALAADSSNGPFARFGAAGRQAPDDGRGLRRIRLTATVPDACCSASLEASRSCSRPSGRTACCRISSASVPRKSASGWRWAPTGRPCWCSFFVRD